jgi:phosphosulfolactate synthase (CoM biosynthesis protein A)
MPKKGYKSLSVKDDFYTLLERVYTERLELLQRHGIRSVSAWVNQMVDAFLTEGETHRVEHIKSIEKVVKMRDKELNKVVTVKLVKGVMVCWECGSSRCIHSDYARQIHGHYVSLQPSK